VVGLALEQPLSSRRYLAQIGLNQARLTTGALLELVMRHRPDRHRRHHLPVLRQFSERLAVGYVAARTVEGVIIVLGTINLLTLLTVSGAPGRPGPVGLGDTLLAARDWGGHAVWT
jgi:hypothetical protein